MAPLPPVHGVIALVTVWTLGTDPAVMCRLHAIYTGSALTNADATNVAGQYWNIVAADIMPHASPGLNLTKVEVVDLSSPSAGMGTHTGTVLGTAAGGALPANCAVLANAAIQRRYRGGKPRTYWPMGTQNDLKDSQHWLPASITNFNNAVANIYTGLGGLTFSSGQTTGPCSVSYYEGATWYQQDPPNGPYKRTPTLRATPVVDPINSWTVNPIVGTMRRRMRGTGA